MGNTITPQKQKRILALLAKGESIRSAERITGVHRDTIMRLKNLGPVSERAGKVPKPKATPHLILPPSVLAEYKRLAKAAASAVCYAMNSGKMPRLDKVRCVDCGAQSDCYDHRDYLKPLAVEPVCKKHNTARGMALDTFINHRDYWRKFGWVVETETHVIAIRQK